MNKRIYALICVIGLLTMSLSMSFASPLIVNKEFDGYKFKW